MPGLVAFNRRWSIGSDDLFVPTSLEILLRIAWLISISAVFHLHKTAFDCTGGYLLKTYYVGFLTILSAEVLLNLIIGYVSLQGTIANPGPRRKMALLLYLKFSLFAPELIWNILGTYWGFGDSSNCEEHVVMTVQGAVICGWILGVFVCFGIAFVFDPLGKLTGTPSNTPRLDGQLESDETDQLIKGMSTTAKRIWTNRCKFICCCAGCDEQHNNAFSEIAQIFADFFLGVDLVPSDIAAGLIILEHQQSRDSDMRLEQLIIEDQPSDVANTSSELAAPSIGNLVNVDDGGGELNVSPEEEPHAKPPHNTKPLSWMRIDSVAHYMKFAFASYGWPLYVFSNLTTGSCNLCEECRCCTCANTTTIDNDNCCMCHTAAILKKTQIREEDIIYASFHNKIYEIPFFVALDHDRKAVVISIRGTLSLRDVLTDLCCDSEVMDIPGVEDTHVHKGILGAARFIQQTLHEKQLLDIAFLRAEDYDLVICGHSLGAGSAALLAILLKPKYPNLRCYSYSPPGGLMSLQLSRYTSDFICSVVLGNDIVPRLGIVTVDNLKVQLLQVIKDCNKPKHHIIAGGCWKIFCTNPEQSELSRHLLQDSVPRSYSSSFEDSLQDAIMRNTQHRVASKCLYPPGKILYIIEEHPKQGCFGVPVYNFVWSQVMAFDKIVVSPKMISDHMPEAVQTALDQLVEQGRSFPRHRTVSVRTTALPDPRCTTCDV